MLFAGGALNRRLLGAKSLADSQPSRSTFTVEGRFANGSIRFAWLVRSTTPKVFQFPGLVVLPGLSSSSHPECEIATLLMAYWESFHFPRYSVRDQIPSR